MPARSLTFGLAAAVAALLATLGGRPPRAVGHGPARVPVAFWAWQARTPSPSGVRRAIGETNAYDLFLRAGQFDRKGAGATRIRPAEGAFPAGVRLRLVYNATPALLDAFGALDADAFAAGLARAAAEDTARALADGATVAGVQLDLDAPTRLLPGYAEILRASRRALPSGLELSMTGLPTWLSSPDLAAVVDAVDFWVPQCYGTDVARRAETKVPVATPAEVASAVARAEALGRPYYAGLASYGLVARYDARGDLAELRGDLDPALVATVVNLELVEHAEYPTAPGEWRDVYRARAACAVGGLALEAGDTLVVDVPTAEWLRGCARAARDASGANLRGVCVFRLPDEADRTALTIEEVRAALEDRDASPAAVVTARVRGDRLVVEVTNAGDGAPVPSAEALTADVRVPAGAVASAAAGDLATVELLGEWGGESHPCSPRRATLARVRAASWRPSETVRAELRLAGPPPASVEISLAASTGAGAPWRETRTVEVAR